MSNKAVVADGNVVTIHYTLRDSDGDLLDTSVDGGPLEYLHGAENIVPGLERQLVGRSVGDKLSVVVSPDEGYGEREGPEPQKVPLSAFPEDAELEEGMQIVAQAPDGKAFPLWVVEVAEEHVMLDHNHPLAGVTLHFDVEIAGIRVASSEEMAHGHPHGPHGHHH